MTKKKLIEVALPLEAINTASAKEKSIRHGHPSTLHLWWARRPLAACRAMLFASLVDDPSSRLELSPKEVEAERERLFRLIEKLVLWENVNNEAVLREAREEILKSTGKRPPAIYDPFCGGGSIPLEAQRLGLEAHASDLNPVAVLITKALIEIPPKFIGQEPVNPEAKKRKLPASAYPGARGLAEDVRYYGAWIRDRAEERIGHLYPKVKVAEGNEATVIAWLWARTVQCPNPACSVQLPMVRSFALSTKQGNVVSLQPEIDSVRKVVRFHIDASGGSIQKSTKTGRGAKFLCIACNQMVPETYIKTEGQSGRIGTQLLATVAETKRGRVYIAPDQKQVDTALSAVPSWVPSGELAHDPRNIWCVQYGIRNFEDLFTRRQLAALTAFTDLVQEARSRAVADGALSGRADAIAVYLALAASKAAVFHNSLARWRAGEGKSAPAFGRQAIPMVWDFAEVNPFAGAGGDFMGIVEGAAKVVADSPGTAGRVEQVDATAPLQPGPTRYVVSTDPPYYDNISYADLSDFFYVWLRKSTRGMDAQLFSTLLTPKKQELIASPYRFEGHTDDAKRFFEEGFGKAFHNIRSIHNPDYPLTIYYAFKQSEADEDDDGNGSLNIASTGWETMLEGLILAGLQVTGTWPTRTEGGTRLISMGTNSLASSVVLVCRPRTESATVATRKDFLSALKRELPPAMRALQQGNIAPVDLQQAAIGPGMSIFSRYAKVVDWNGERMPVKVALQLINHALDEILTEQEADFDSATQWALTWFEQNEFTDGTFGDANTLANAKALSVEGLQHSNIVSARAGKVRLLRREELDPDWDPTDSRRLTVWHVTQHLVRRLNQGEDAARELVSRVGGLAETARELAYRLYTLCERKGWAEEAGNYNSLVVSWPAIRPAEFALSGE